MKIIRKLAGSVIVLVLLAAFLNVISKPPALQKQGGLLDKEQEAVKELEQFKSGGASLENSRFKLTVEGKYGSVTITDKNTNTTWTSVPEAETKKLPSNNKRYVRSPVFVRYSEGKETVQTYPFKEQGTLSVQQKGDGIQLNYNLKKIGISFSMAIRLRDDGLEATIPFASVKEGNQYKLISIEPFPFFEAGTEAEKGAVVLPDGAGSLISFTKQHPKYFAGYSQFIYGGDQGFPSKVLESTSEVPMENVSYWRQEKIALPVFGIYRENRSFLGIVTQGDQDAKINAMPSGIRNIKLYRASAEFLYRYDDLAYLGGRGEVPLLQSRFVTGDRQVRYVLLDKDKPGYVGMAEAYRDYLIKEKGVKPVSANTAPFQLRLLGGVKQDEVTGTSFVSVTTFEQARTIIDELIKQGINALDVMYDGWSKDGLYGDQPKHLPAASQLGGNDALKKLADYAKQKGFRLFLKTNYVRVDKAESNFNPSNDAIRGLNKELMISFDAKRTTRQPHGSGYYFVRPDAAYDKFVSREADKLAQQDVQGVSLGSMGSYLYSDPGSANPLFRKDALQAWVKSLDLMRKATGASAADYGFGYVLGHVDRIDDIPLDSSHFLYADRTIPFFQIAVHGLVPYTSEPLNLSDTPQADFLRAVEYGAIPSYTMTYDETSKLQRSWVDDLVSSYYKDWVQPAAQTYKKAADALSRVQDKTITGHDALSANVYRTTYSDGSQIIVNYGNTPADVGGTSVPANDFTIVAGKEGTG